MKLDLARHAPLGFNLRHERQFFVTGMVCAVLYSFTFPYRYANALTQLYRYEGTKRVLPADAAMPDFSVLLDTALVGFFILALCMLALIPYHYAYHYQGGRSIYLMRRLPNRWELHRRCLTLPLLAVALCLLAAFMLLLIYFGVYMAITPEICLTPGQWAKIWSVF